MRRFAHLSVFGLVAGLLAACTPEEVIQTEDIPTAGVRFINAVPDTGAMDMRAVDITENTTFYNVAFRGTALLFYKNAAAGSRHFRIFQSPDASKSSAVQIAMAQVVFADTTVTLEAGKRYTFLMWGNARGNAPAMRLAVLTDDPADPGNQVALRFINAGAGLGAIDARQYPSTGTAPATPDWPAVAELTAGAYIMADTGVKKFNIRSAGGATALFTDPTALAGTYAVSSVVIGTPNTCPPKDPALCDLEATPGTQVAGSAVSAILVPRSVAGSTAPSFTTPALMFAWDKRPPRTQCGRC